MRVTSEHRRAVDPGATSTAPSLRVSAESCASAASIRGDALLRSTDVGWTSLLLHLRENPWSGEPALDAPHHEFELPPTPDQIVVVAVDGEFELEALVDGVWRRDVRQPGSIGLTPGGHADRLRWRARRPGPVRTAHLYLPAELLVAAEDEFRRAGSPPRSSPLASRGVHEPTIAHAVLSLVRAVRTGAPELYAESVAQFLAVHLLAPHAGWRESVGDHRSPGLMTDRRLARAVEYLSAHFHEAVSLDRLASEAAVSKFHFTRLFRTATGQTPHAYLVGLRLASAQRLLRETDLSVAEVAAACGFASSGHLGQSLARATGQTPTAYRARRGRGGMP